MCSAGVYVFVVVILYLSVAMSELINHSSMSEFLYACHSFHLLSQWHNIHSQRSSSKLSQCFISILPYKVWQIKNLPPPVNGLPCQRVPLWTPFFYPYRLEKEGAKKAPSQRSLYAPNAISIRKY